MTTIATDGKSMAADGMVSDEGMIHGLDVVKIVRTSHGSLVGVAGDAYNIPLFLEWYESGSKEKPDLSEAFEAISLSTDGKCRTFNHKCVAIDQSLPAVLGTGGALALGAMLAGASPGRAVEIAVQRDIRSGGNVLELHL